MRGLVGIVAVLALAGCEADGRPSPWVGSALKSFNEGLNGPSRVSATPVRSIYEVACITRDKADRDGSIDALGGPAFYAKLDDVVSAIEGGTTLYTKVQGREAKLFVVEQSYPRRKYIRTELDGYNSNNLLSLPEC